MSPARFGQRGFALLTVLVAIVLLSSLVLGFHYGGRVQLRLVSREATLEQTRLAARSGVTVARRILEADSDEVDALTDPWALPLEMDWEELHASITIEDEGGKLGLGGLMELDAAERDRRAKELERLARLLGQSPSFGPALLDWIDEDDQARPGGAEHPYYLSLGYPCKNRSPDTAFELYRVRHAVAQRPEERTAWESWLSARNAEEINVNTAPLEVLLSISDELSRSLAEAIVGRRLQKPFERVSQLKEVPGLSQAIYNELFERLTNSSNRFRIRSTATLQGARSTVIAEVERSGSTTRLLYWSLR